jgi:hypothetical protein
MLYLLSTTHHITTDQARKQSTFNMSAETKQDFYDQLDEAKRPINTQNLIGAKTTTNHEFFDIALVAEDPVLLKQQYESNQLHFPSWMPSTEEDNLMTNNKRRRQNHGSGRAGAGQPELTQQMLDAPPVSTGMAVNNPKPWPRGQTQSPGSTASFSRKDPLHPASAKARLTGFDPEVTIPSGQYDPHAALRSLRFAEQGLPFPNEEYNEFCDKLMSIPHDDPSLKIVPGGDVHIVCSNFDIGAYNPQQIISAIRDLRLPVNPRPDQYRIGRAGDHFVSIPAPGMSPHLWNLFRARVVSPAGVPMRIQLGVH